MKNELRTEMERMCKALPQEPPHEVAERVRASGFLSRDALVYSVGYYPDPMDDMRKKKAVMVKCTRCGGESYLEYIKIESGCGHYGCADSYGFRDVTTSEMVMSGDNATCPNCLARCRALRASHIGNRRSYEIDEDNVITVHNVLGHLAVLAWKIFKCVTKEAKVVYGSARMQGVGVIGRKMVRFAGCQHNYNNALTFYSSWQPRYTYEDKLGAFDRMHIFVDSPQTVESTDSANCALDVYMDTPNECYPSSYLETWCGFPQVENLVRQGCQHLLTTVIEKNHVHYGWYVEKQKYKAAGVKDLLNVNEVKPHRILGIEKSEMWVPRVFCYDTFAFYRDIKNGYGVRLSEEQLRIAERSGLSALRELFNSYSAPVERTVNYIGKQQVIAQGVRIDAQYLKDYWEYLRFLYGEVSHSLRFPPKLRKAHDEKMKLYTAAKDELTNSGIVRRAEELANLAWSDDERGLFIRPCLDQAELIAEGKVLDHCVARYGEDIAKRKTSIFFIRRSCEPEAPFFTLEYKDGQINQNRGHGNCNPPPEVKGFANEWLDLIKKGILGDKNGKRDHKCEREPALA